MATRRRKIRRRFCRPAPESGPEGALRTHRSGWLYGPGRGRTRGGPECGRDFVVTHGLCRSNPAPPYLLEGTCLFQGPGHAIQTAVRDIRNRLRLVRTPGCPRRYCVGDMEFGLHRISPHANRVRKTRTSPGTRCGRDRRVPAGFRVRRRVVSPYAAHAWRFPGICIPCRYSADGQNPAGKARSNSYRKRDISR